MIITSIILLFNLIFTPTLMCQQVQEVDCGTFMSMLNEKNIGKVQVNDSEIVFTDKDNTTIYSSGATFAKEVQKTTSPLLSYFLTGVLPLLIFIGIGQHMSKKLMEQAGGKNAMSFGTPGKSNARVYHIPAIICTEKRTLSSPFSLFTAPHSRSRADGRCAYGTRRWTE